MKFSGRQSENASLLLRLHTKTGTGEKIGMIHLHFVGSYCGSNLGDSESIFGSKRCIAFLLQHFNILAACQVAAVSV